MYNWELSKIKICLWGKMLGKIEGKNRRGWQRMRCLDSTTHSTDMNLSKVWEMVKDREAWHPTVHGAAKSRTHLATEWRQWQQQQTSPGSSSVTRKETWPSIPSALPALPGLNPSVLSFQMDQLPSCLPNTVSCLRHTARTCQKKTNCSVFFR